MSRQQYVRVCGCGCGRPTLLALKTNTDRGWIKDQPLEYLRGHLGGRRRTDPWYVVNEATGCWEWQRPLSKGYGRVHVFGKLVRAHRAVYEQHKGPIPDGLHLDHLCCVTWCVNPDHLEPVTCAENSRRQHQRKQDA